MTLPRNPIVVIPARLASTRLPDKPLAEIHGVPMIVHVWRRAAEAGIGPVAVACAEPEIAEGVPPPAGTPRRAARDLDEDFDALSLAVQSASPPEHPYGRASTTGAAATEDAAARDSHEDLAALALAVQEASPPSHPFGRTATTRQ